MFKKRRIRKRTINWLRAKGCYVMECLQTEFDDPNIIVCIKGEFMAIKFFRDSKYVHHEKYVWADKLHKIGGKVAYVTPDTFELFKAMIRQMLKNSGFIGN